MAFEFKLPDIGEGVVEGEIVKWLVASGDTVTEDQPLVEIMTDKATVEIPSPQAGVVSEVRGAEGDTVPVGDVLVVIDTDGAGGGASDGSSNGGAAAAPAQPEAAAQPQAAPAAQPEPAPAAAAPAAAAPAASPAPAAAPERAPAAASAAATATATAPAPPMIDGRKILATPAVRKLARESGIDLAQVPASGNRGRVTREDVERFAISGAGTPSSGGLVVQPAAADERIPFRGMRRRISEGMVRSKSTIPHFTYVEEVDVTELKKFREASKEYAGELGGKLTYLPYIIKALIRGFEKFPMLNSTLDEEAGEIILKKAYNIGIAAATPQGLIVPVVKDCKNRTLLEISQEVFRVAGEAREGKSKLDDLKGGTFTITNLGPIGGLMATPIINFPEVAILGVHKMRVVPKWENDEWVPRDVMNLSISLDHRIIDGAVGAEFLQYVIRYLENPWLLLVESR